jgi:hypothetical protein
MSKSDELEFIGHIYEELKFVIQATNSVSLIRLLMMKF